MKLIKLTQNQYALVDDADYDWLNQWKWYAHKRCGLFYATRNSTTKNGKRHAIHMHREILDLEQDDKRVGDHRDYNSLNNQRYNLRLCTHQQNDFNKKSRKNTTSSFKGVSWKKQIKRWCVQILINGKKKHLGYFHNEIFAAGVYDKAAIREFGEYAYLNFKLTNTEILIQ